MFCKKCGTEVPGNSKFCPKCGEPQMQRENPGITAAYPVPQRAGAAAEGAALTKRPWWKRPSTVILAVAAAVLAVVGGLALRSVLEKDHTAPLKKMVTNLEEMGQISSSLLSLYPDAIWDEMSGYMGGEILGVDFGKMLQLALSEGKLEIDYEIVMDRAATQEEIRELEEDLEYEDIYLVIEDMRELTVQWGGIYGEILDPDLTTQPLWVMKVDGEWYLSPYAG